MFTAQTVPGAILVGTGYVPCELNYIAVVCLVIAVGFTGFERSGYMVNPQDIASK